MAVLIEKPTVIRAAGNKSKEIQEYIGRVNTLTPELSIARMISPQGWEEPGQTPEFSEYTLVLQGSLLVTTRSGEIRVNAGHAILTEPGEWVKYSSPFEGGAEYIAVCLPAFSPDTVHRDDPTE
jgi:mannose-6-phosphate isomerase-like protein (cupin superfamily)